MKIEDFKAEMSKIKALSDSPEMIEILTGLEADYQNVLNEHNKAIEERDSAIAEKQDNTKTTGGVKTALYFYKERIRFLIRHHNRKQLVETRNGI